MAESWYPIDNADEVDTPALLVYPDRAEENTRRMIRYAGGVERLRPHVKTHKMPQIIQMQMALGIDKFKCATISEAEMVADCGAADVMVAYQIIGPKARRFAALVAKFPNTQFCCMEDCESGIRDLSSALVEAGQQAECLLDIDNGMARSGIPPGEEALELYRLIDALPGVTPGGLHVYDGQFRDPDLEKRTQECDEAFAMVEAFRRQLIDAGLAVPRVVAGGTPSFPVHAHRKDVQCSPGTCIFWDANYGGKFPDLEFQNAALLMTRVISKPAQDRLCLDLGYKAVSPDNPDPRAVLLDVPDAKTKIHNEEHLTIETAHAGEFEVGDVLYAIPFHVCPTVALHQWANAVRDHRVVEQWSVLARDRKLTV